MNKYIIFICFLLSSCVVTKKQKEKFCNTCAIHVTEYVKDSIYIRDTLVNIKPDSSTIEALLKCDSLGNITIAELSSTQGKLNNLQLQLTNNKIKTISKTDTIKVFVKGNTEIKYKEKIVEKEVLKVEYKEYWWKWVLIVWSIFTTVVFIISNKI